MSVLTRVKHRENTDRKDFTPSEAVKAWQEIETKQGERSDLKELLSESDRGSPRKQATKLTGMSTDTLSKAKQVKPVKQADSRLINQITLGNNAGIMV